MRVLWISLFLIGSITCVPYGGYDKPAGQSGSYSSSGSFPSYGALSQPSTGYSSSGSSYQPTGDAGSFSSYKPQNQPGSTGYSGFSGSFQPAGGAGSGFTSGVQQGSQSGSTGSHSQFAQGGGSSSYDDGDKEPDFTPVSAEDQVYARKSRSHYRKSNLRYHEFVYIPTEPVEPQEPIFPHHGKTSQHSKGF